MVFHFIEFTLMFFTLPETKGRSIEEITHIFHSSNPVKESLRKTTITVYEKDGVKEVAADMS